MKVVQPLKLLSNLALVKDKAYIICNEGKNSLLFCVALLFE
jgi:hypothetical protein